VARAFALFRTTGPPSYPEVPACASSRRSLAGPDSRGSTRPLTRVALAADDLTAARSHIRNAMTLLATSPPALAGARAVWSQILVESGHTADAVAEATAAVATVDALGGIEEFESLARLALVEALTAAGDTAAAHAALTRATARLHERAAAIGDPTLRASFLDGVPENRRTLELAR